MSPYRTPAPIAPALLTPRERMWLKINITAFSGLVLFFGGWLLLACTKSRWLILVIFVGWLASGIGSFFGLWHYAEERRSGVR